MIISVHAGHNPDGKIACGACGIMKESTSAREITNHLCKNLRDISIPVYNDTVDDGKNQSDVLKKIIANISSHDTDLAISIHLNSAKENSANGVEAYVWDLNTNTAKLASYILQSMSHDLGYKNRGVKERKDLYVIRKTKCPTILLECGFVTNEEDCKRYNPEYIAKCIVNSIILYFSTTRFYKIRVDSIMNRDTAYSAVEKLKAIGINCSIEEV